ncbi:RHS repeat-associated core domain-containing protein [Paenibacillus sp. FSL H8-0048]|uniref:RHS repeat domain-containing protein n=1 Tax=Paenibacillus sp. FSL H8-0048 TaxID=2954508 RepID=UPI0030F5B146
MNSNQKAKSLFIYVLSLAILFSGFPNLMGKASANPAMTTASRSTAELVKSSPFPSPVPSGPSDLFLPQSPEPTITPGAQRNAPSQPLIADEVVSVTQDAYDINLLPVTQLKKKILQKKERLQPALTGMKAKGILSSVPDNEDLDLKQADIEQLVQAGASKIDVYWLNLLVMGQTKWTAIELLRWKQDKQASWEDIQATLDQEMQTLHVPTVGEDVYDPNLLQQEAIGRFTVRSSVYEPSKTEMNFSADPLSVMSITAFDAAVSGVIDRGAIEAQINQVQKPQFSDRNTSSETIDPVAGSVTRKESLLHLPGVDGLDLNVGLMYNSNQGTPFVYRSYYSNYWQMWESVYEYATPELGNGWSFQFPYVQMGENQSFYHDGNGSVYAIGQQGDELSNYSNLINYKGKDRRIIFESRYSGQFNNGQDESRYYMEYSDMKREYFSSRGELLGIKDRFGNTITFKYSDADNGRLSSITDTLGRMVLFSYEYNLHEEPFNGERITLRVMNGTKEVQKVILTKGRVAVDVPKNFAPAIKVYQPVLSSITNSIGESTYFNYDNQLTLIPYNGFNFEALLSEVNYPHSSTKYNYEYVSRHMSNSDSFGEFRATSRSDYMGGKAYQQLRYTYTGDYTGNTPEQYPGHLPDDFRYSTTSAVMSSTPSNGLSTTHTFDKEGRVLRSETVAGNGERKIIENTAFHGLFTQYPTRTTISEYAAQDSDATAKQLYTETTYTNWGQVQSQTEPLTAEQWNNPNLKQHYTTSYQYEPTYRFPASVSKYQNESDANPLVESYTYTAEGRPATVINAKNEQTSYTYGYIDGQGKIEHATADIWADARLVSKSVVRYGSENNYAYPTEQQQWFNIGTADEKAVTTKMLYNKDNGQVIQKTEANNQTVAYEYDAAGRLKKETYPIKINAKGEQIQELVDYNYYNQSSPNFDATNAGTQVLKVDSITTVNNITRGMSMKTYANVLYNGLGLALLEEHYDENVSNWVFTQYHYDDQGRPVYSIDSAGNTLTASYDAWGRQNRATTPSGDVMVSDYDLKSRTATSYIQDHTTGQTLNYIQESYDSWGKKLSVSTFKDWPTKQQSISESYRYNIAGQVTGYTDPNRNLNEDGVTTSYRYDALGRLTALKDALNQMTSYSYDGNGQVTKVTIQAKGGTPQTLNTKIYNELGLPSVKQDGASQSESYTYNSTGQLAAKTDRNGSSFAYAYDEAGQLKKNTIQGKINNVDQKLETVMIPGDGSPRKQTIQTLLNQAETAYQTITRDSLGQVRSIYGRSGSHYVSIGNQVDVLGRMTQISDQYMSFFTNYTYQQSRVTQVQTNGSAAVTGAASANAQYTYFGNDQVKSITYPTLTDGSTLKTEYTYNPSLGWTERMTNTKGNFVLTAYSYSYDNNGNRVAVSESRNGGGAQTTNYGYDALNRLISISRPDGGQTTYTYDVRGNRLTLSDTSTVSLDSADTSYTYDLQNTLTSVTKGGASTSFQYYADGMRSIKTKDNTQTQVNYNFQGQVISEEKIVNGQFVEQANFVRGDRVLVKKDKKSTKDYYYLYNGHGDVVQIVDTSGTVMNNYAYDEWGNITSQVEKTSNSFKYTGEVYDEETGLYYLRARYYDPSMGRFLNEDTYEGQITNPLSLNLYTYVHNNPLRYSDPSGNMPKDLLNAIFSTYTKRNDTKKMIQTVLTTNGEKGIYQAFHEITQVIAGSAIHKQTGLDVQLEYHLEKDIPWRLNKHYWADIVSSDYEMWEVKPRSNVFNLKQSYDGIYENAEEQLNNYASLNTKLTRGQQFENIYGIEIVDMLRMNITFHDKGKILYDFYLDLGEGKTINLTTFDAAYYLQANFDYGPDLSDFIQLKPGKGKK